MVQMFKRQSSASTSTKDTQLLLLQPSGNLSKNNDRLDDSQNFEASGSLTKKSRSYSKWSPHEEGVTLAWNDLTVHAYSKDNRKPRYKRIINSVTGALKAGSLAALMGASLGFICPSSYSPADFFIKTLATMPGHESNSKMAVKRICDHFSVSDYAKEVDVVVQYEFHMGRAEARQFELRTNFKAPFWWQKLYWLTYRWSKDALRNPSVQTLRILQRIAIAILIGLCYLRTNAFTQNGVQAVEGAIVIFVVENTFNPMYSVLAEFPENTPIFLREYRSGLYHPATYYLSRIVALFPGFIIESVVFVMIAYWMVGLRETSYAFLMTVLVIILTTNVSAACGIMFSNAFQSVPNAMAYLVPFDTILMVTSGLFIKRGTIPIVVGWTRYLSWLMYSTESISILQWQGITQIACDNRQDVNLPCLTDGTSVLDKYSFSEDNLSCDIWNMFFLLIAFHLLGYVCLWWKTKKA
ncbi:unnamed protein product [Ceutorhynchus assimilis]|uniref:ABC-2 type transporter transmembrane domain-containing protein n=1 Tax=Ceutorhynchus assimilis TaxID=467358 RepID=A0A9N9MBC7_9CUCU|nr:unnamed protein product [Ceutorhynchus assimilis]